VTIEQKLLEKTGEAILTLYGQSIPADKIGFEKTRKEIEGDFTIVVFPVSKIAKKSPEATAKEIGDYLVKHVEEIREYNIIKGFLNIILKESFWLSFLEENCNREDFGLTAMRDERPVIVEYSSPNTNKPLHLGHIRNNLLGFSLGEILKANGYKVIRTNLVNDRGIHICKSMLAYMRWGNGETPESTGMKGDHLVGKYYVLFDKYYKEEVKSLIEQGQKEEDAEKIAPLLQEAQDLLRKWEGKDRETLDLWHRMNGWVYEGFDETYRRMGVSFDVVQYESSTYLLGKEIVKDGFEKGFLVQKPDGSIWADLRDEGLDEKVLMRADGTSVYMTQDIGTAQLRFQEFNPLQMIYVVGNEQVYHFDVLKLVLKKLGKDWSDRIYHLSYGMVELPHGKMKSREGTVVDADDLMDEMYATAEETTRQLGKVNEFSEEEARNLFFQIGHGALKYFILKVDPKKNMMFDPKESIDFNGNTGPFIQYTYARIQSLLRKATVAGYKLQSTGHKVQDDPGYLPFKSLKPEAWGLKPLEIDILKLLYTFPQTVQQAGTELSPARIANYVYELAKGYNQFYQEIPVLKENAPSLIATRLMLSSFTGDVIRKSMSLLGIEVPSRM
jgi:arginyl-tRNA synthetase